MLMNPDCRMLGSKVTFQGEFGDRNTPGIHHRENTDRDNFSTGPETGGEAYSALPPRPWKEGADLTLQAE